MNQPPFAALSFFQPLAPKAGTCPLLSNGGLRGFCRSANYLGFVKLACIRLWLHAYESTA
jgi:hypothetical protein